MKNITKIMIGAGLTVAALGAAAGPATAATTTEASTLAAGDRVVGPFVLDNNQSENYVYGVRDPYTNGGISAIDFVRWPAWVPKVYSFPAPGTQGPVIHEASGLCLEPVSLSEAAGVVARTCNGGVMQMWEFAAGAKNPVTTIVQSVADSKYGMGLSRGDVNDLQIHSRNGQVPEAFDMSRLAPVAGTVVPVDITGATTETRPTLSGTGDEGATVVVTLDGGTVVGSAVVVGGQWSIPSTVDIADGSTHFTATQTAADGSVSTDDITVTIVGTPVVDPMIAGGAGLALLAAAGVFIAKRRQNATVVA